MILPVEYPPITSSPEYADLLSAILPRKSGRDWLYNNFIQLFVDFSYFDYGEIRFRENLFALNKLPDFFYYQYNPFIHCYTVAEDFSLFFDADRLVDKLKAFIDNGYYVIVYLDRHFIDAKHKKGSLHNALVYGYDDSSFKIADFVSESGGYLYTQIYFSDVIASFGAEHALKREFGVDSRCKLVMFKVKDAEYQRDDVLMRKLIEDYYHERNTTESYECLRRLSDNQNAIWGMGCIKHVALSLNQIASAADHTYERELSRMTHKELAALKGVHMLLEHKTVMKDRIGYLHEKGIIEDEKRLFEYGSIVDTMKTCMNRVVQYGYSGRVEQLTLAVSKLDEVYNEEKIFFRKLLEEPWAGVARK